MMAHMNHSSGDTLSQPALELESVGRSFGKLKAVSDVTMVIKPGERRAILGPNGAGKTTLFNTILGDFPPTSGRILLFGEDITKAPPHQRIRRGIGRTYQTSLLFDGLTVLDNLFMAVRGVMPGRMSFLRPRKNDPAMMRASEMADKMRIKHLLDRTVSEISYGQRRQVEIGMALASNPRLLMLDEPAAGLSPVERPELNKLLADLPHNLTLILIEHDMDVALRNSDFVTIMKDGEIVAQDVPDQITNNPVVREIYLGSAH
ncbi:ABC transporter ATP-binding protein [Brucella gallinifaecis]